MRRVGTVVAGSVAVVGAGAAWVLKRNGLQTVRRLVGRGGGADTSTDFAAPDDPTLKAKVESEIFRDADAPKDRVSVNSQYGVIQLRGEIESQELIDELVERARAVQGVREVENLLHVPGEPAPMHE